MKSIHSFFLAVILLMSIAVISSFHNDANAQTLNYLQKITKEIPPVGYGNSLLYENSNSLYLRDGTHPIPIIGSHDPKFTINAANNTGPGLKITGIETGGTGIEVDGLAKFNGYLNILGINTTGRSLEAQGTISAPILHTNNLSIGNYNEPGRISTCADHLDINFQNESMACDENLGGSTTMLRIFYESGATLKGILEAGGIKIPTNAALGKVLVSDKEGNGVWTSKIELNDNDWIRSVNDDLLSNCRFVGIGIPNPLTPLTIPDSKLFVTSDDATNWATKILNTNANGKGLFIKGGYRSSKIPLIQIQDPTGQIEFVANSDGTCGIGTPNPTKSLDIRGDLRVTQGIYGNELSYIPPCYGKLKLFGSILPNAATIEIGNGDGSNLGIMLTTPLETADIQNWIGGKLRMSINKDRVSIGSLASTTGLLVYGSTTIGQTSAPSSLLVNGPTTIGQTSAPSSLLVYGPTTIGQITSPSSLIVNGIVSIGCTLPTSNINNHSLFVKNGITTQEVIVQNEWSDYVFAKDYSLRSLCEVEKFITEKKHLPEIPSADQVKTNGINLGQMDALLLKKIEELTLYIIEQQKQIDKLKDSVQQIKK